MKSYVPAIAEQGAVLGTGGRLRVALAAYSVLKKSSFHSQASCLRNDWKLNHAETSRISVRPIKTKQELVSKLGLAIISAARQLESLSVSQCADNHAVVQDTRCRTTGKEGTFMYCDVDYVLMPDRDETLRKADIHVALDSDRLASSTGARSRLLQGPKR